MARPTGKPVYEYGDIPTPGTIQKIQQIADRQELLIWYTDNQGHTQTRRRRYSIDREYEVKDWFVKCLELATKMVDFGTEDLPPRRDYRQVPVYTSAKYRVDVGWHDLERQLEHYGDSTLYQMDLDPDFQRGHVWSKAQQIAYVEHALRGGKSSMELQFNCAGWFGDWRGPLYLVDGKQRLTAALGWLHDEVPAWGTVCSRWEPIDYDVHFGFNINDLNTKVEVMNWYLQLNEGGVVHTSGELQKVHDMIAEERERE